MILAQKDYSAVWTINPKTKKIQQFYGDLDAVGQDKFKALEMCEFLKIKNFGPNDQYIINKDPEKDRSVTITELNKIF